MNMLSLFANHCKGNALFGIPSWNKNLSYKSHSPGGPCELQAFELNDIWQIALAILEILMRLSAYVAVAFVIVGGIRFITSNGSPERIAQARSTLINAVIGLAISIAAVQIVAFIARSL